MPPPGLIPSVLQGAKMRRTDGEDVFDIRIVGAHAAWDRAVA
jgi:hypothetical protein